MKEDERHIVTLRVVELQEAIKKTVQDELDKHFTIEKRYREDDLTESLIPRKKVAALFKVSTVSLDKWRRLGLLPKPIKQGGRVYYIKKEILELIQSKKLNLKT
jgi:predicted DNA-binding transcriptional regulator AlpA